MHDMAMVLIKFAQNIIFRSRQKYDIQLHHMTTEFCSLPQIGVNHDIFQSPVKYIIKAVCLFSSCSRMIWIWKYWCLVFRIDMT